MLFVEVAQTVGFISISHVIRHNLGYYGYIRSSNRSRLSQESQTSQETTLTIITDMTAISSMRLDRPTLKQYIDSPPDYDSLEYNTLPSYGEAINKLKADLFQIV